MTPSAVPATIVSVALLTLMAVATAACGPTETALEGDGMRREFARTYPSFTSVQARGPLQLLFRPQEDARSQVDLALAGDSNLIELVDVQLMNERMVFTPLQELEPKLFLVVEGEVPLLRSLWLEEQAHVHMHGFRDEELHVNARHESSVELDNARYQSATIEMFDESRGRIHGKVRALILSASGESRVELAEADIREAHVVVTGKAYVRLCAKDLDVTVRDEATVIVTCNPRGSFRHSVEDDGVLQIEPSY